MVGVAGSEGRGGQSSQKRLFTLEGSTGTSTATLVEIVEMAFLAREKVLVERIVWASICSLPEHICPRLESNSDIALSQTRSKELDRPGPTVSAEKN